MSRHNGFNLEAELVFAADVLAYLGLQLLDHLLVFVNELVGVGGLNTAR